MKNNIFYSRYIVYWLIAGTISELISSAIGAEHRWYWWLSFIVATLIFDAIDRKFILDKRKRKYSESEENELRNKFMVNLKIAAYFFGIVAWVGLVGILTNLMFVSLVNPLVGFGLIAVLLLIAGVAGLVMCAMLYRQLKGDVEYLK